MSLPSTKELIDHVSEHYGITKTQAVGLLRVPLHPATLRDQLAIGAFPTLLAYGSQATGWSHQDLAEHVYGVADACLKERLR